MKALLSIYRPRFATVLAYMLQNVEYQPAQYLRWFWRTQNFDNVMYRRELVPTGAARALRAVLYAGMFFQFSLGIGFIVQWLWQDFEAGWQFGLALLLSYPIVWAHLVAVPLALGRWLIVVPRQRRDIGQAEAIFAGHSGLRIAVAGSYGKTTMKELLYTVLAEGKKVAATPANKNVSISHAAFARTLTGDEEVLILEYGEGQPGDVLRFARRTHPTHAVLTGLAAAHLDRYRTVEAAGRDIFSLATVLPSRQLYANAESVEAAAFLTDDMEKYSIQGALGWRVTKIKVTAEGVSFTLGKGKRKLQLASGLLGRHNIGPLAFAAAFALELGLSNEQVVAGVAKTAPFEHRMQPRYMSGALVLDDTYNGNLEGVRAGTALLKELPAQRKWYVTPGLVDQGKDSAEIHQEMGRLVAAARPDVVVLMANSACASIHAGLNDFGFEGEVRIEDDPLHFYTNLPHFLAAGDVVLMQNDWTDNYA